MRVLGIDPGSRNTGLGVVEDGGGELRLVAYQKVSPRAKDIGGRLGEIFRGVQAMINAHTPDAVAVEQVFFAANARSALVLGQAMGVAMCAAAIAGYAVAEYSALQIKRAVVGGGRAEKFQVQHMVRALLGLQATPSSDEADALACAICHIHTLQVAAKLARGQ